MNTSLTAKGEIFIQQISNYLFKNREQKLKMLFTKLRTETRDSLYMRGDCSLTRCFAFGAFIENLLNARRVSLEVHV